MAFPMKMTLLAAAVVLTGSAARAHIVMTNTQAAPGSGYVGALRVSHGCAGGSATTAITVTLPAGVNSAKPQPKPGWTVILEREPLATPIRGEGGQTMTQRVKSITWTGRLSDDQFDEFGMSITLPQASGLLYFPTVQRCEAGENRWTDIPAAGAKWTSVPRPAPVITLTGPSGGAAPMPGMDMGTMSGMAH